MATTKEKTAKKVSEIVSSVTKSQRLVLVGTYKREPDQLKWIGKAACRDAEAMVSEGGDEADGVEQARKAVGVKSFEPLKCG